MSGQEWAPYVVIFAVAALVMWRLDRLGKSKRSAIICFSNSEMRKQSPKHRAREWEENERTKERR